MRSTAGARSFLLWPPRLIGLAGAVLTLFGLAGLVFFIPFVEGRPPPHTEGIATTLALFALLAILGALVPRRRPLLSALLLLIAWVGSVVWGYSFVFVFYPPPIMLIGLGSFILYIIAAVLVALVAFSGPRRGEGG